ATPPSVLNEPTSKLGRGNGRASRPPETLQFINPRNARRPRCAPTARRRKRMHTTARKDSEFPMDVRAAVERYLRIGLAPIPLPHRSKDPRREGWQDLRVTVETLDEYFPPGQLRNVGVLNGEPSGGTADVDLDCTEALAAAALLPPTGLVFGRA